MRTWASVAWVLFAPIAGIVNERYGMTMGAAVYCIGSVLAAPAGWSLPLESLQFDKKKEIPQLPPTPTPTPMPQPTPRPGITELEQPLLAEEAPTPIAPDERRDLSRALAMVRFIEAITELGAVPPPGSLYGFAEVATPYVAGHFRNEMERKEGMEVQESGEVPSNGGGGGEVGSLGTSPTNAYVPQSDTTATGIAPQAAAPTDQNNSGTLINASPSSESSESASSSLPVVEAPPAGLRLRITKSEPKVDLGFKSLTETVNQAGTERSSSIILPRGGISRAVSAGDLLRSVRDIQAYQPTIPKERINNSSTSTSTDGEESSRDVEIKKEDETQGIAPMSSGELIESLEGQFHMGDEEENLDAGPAGDNEVPERITALQRLVQIFNPWRSGSAAATAAEEETPPATPLSTRSSTPQPHSLLTGFTPIRNYIESRRQRLLNLAQQPGTLPPSPSAMRPGANATLMAEPSLATPLPESTTPGEGAIAIPIGTHLLGGANGADYGMGPPAVPAVLRAGISDELMREALDMEAAEVAGYDPTGSLVIDVLSKKLARMAAEAARRKRRHIRKQREKEKRFLATGVCELLSLPSREEREYSPRGRAVGGHMELDGGTVFSRLSVLLRDPSILAFFAIATLLGFGHGLIGTYLFMYLKHLGAGEGLMGAVLLANALPELPVFWFFGSILRTVGMDTLLVASTVTLGLRIGLYSVFGFLKLGVHWVLLLETTHAITYACGWSACALNAAKIAPAGLESTTQAVFQGLWSGVGAGMGGLVGGGLYHWKGPEALFLYSSGAILVGCAVAGIVLAVQHKRRRYKRTHDSSGALASMAH